MKFTFITLFFYKPNIRIKFKASWWFGNVILPHRHTKYSHGKLFYKRFFLNFIPVGIFSPMLWCSKWNTKNVCWNHISKWKTEVDIYYTMCQLSTYLYTNEFDYLYIKQCVSPKSPIKKKQILKSVIALTLNFITDRISCKVHTSASAYIPYSSTCFLYSI